MQQYRKTEQHLQGLITLLFFVMAFSFCSLTQAQDCEKKVYDFENRNAVDVRPLIVEVATYMQKNNKQLTLDCGRRINYLQASLYEINGNMGGAALHYKRAMVQALRCTSDTAIIETFLRAAGFFHRQYDLDRSKQILDSVSIYMKRYFAASRQQVNLEKSFTVYTGASELSSSPDFTLSIKKLSRTQLYLLRLYHQMWGNYYMYENEPADAKQQLLIAYHYAKNNDGDNTEENILNNLGLLLSNEGLYHKAASFFQESLFGYEKQKDIYAMPNTLINLSFCYGKVKDFKKAEAYAVRAKNIARKAGLQAFFCRASVFHAKALLGANHPLEAEAVMRESIDTAVNKGLDAELAYNYRALAEALVHQTGKWKQALAYAEKSRRLTLAIGDSAYLQYPYLTLGHYYSKAKEHKKALEYTKQSIALAVKYNDLADMDIAYKQLADVYTGMGNYKNANESLEKYEQLKDSLANREVQLSLEDLEKKYESQTNQLTIIRLEQERKKREAALQATRTRNRWIGVVAFAALAVAVLLFYLYRKLNLQKETLEQNNEDLERMTSLQSRIFRIIGHDLKGMILPFDRAGKMMNHYLSKHDDSNAMLYAGKLEENALRLTETLNNLLHWSADQLNGQELKKEKLVVKEVLAELLDSFSEVARMKEIVLKDCLNRDEIIYADKGSLQIILRNLLSNAIKFTQHGSIVIFSTSLQNSYTLHVKDEGIGMEAQQVDEVLNNPAQKSNRGTQGEQGSGIGFSIVKKMADLNGATVAVKSSKPGGTIVSVSFPAGSK